MTAASIQANSSDGHRPPLQTDGGADARHDFAGDFVGALGAAGEDVVDVGFVGQDFLPAFAHWGKILPHFFEEFFLEIAITSAAFFESLTHPCNFIF